MPIPCGETRCYSTRMIAFSSLARHGLLRALAASIAVHAAILTWSGIEYARPPVPARATVIAATLVAVPPAEHPVAQQARMRQEPLLRPLAGQPLAKKARMRPAPPRPPAATLSAAPPGEPAREPAEVPRAAAPDTAVSEAPSSSSVVAQEAAAAVAAVPKPHAAETNTAARYLYHPPPQYPMQARRRGLEGRVILRVEILQGGDTGRIEVRQSSGHDVLDQAAIEAVSGWRYAPARMAGAAVSAWEEVPIRFSLTDR